MELIQMLMGQLGVTEDQAKGGAGLLFKMVQEKLLPQEFDQIVRHVPDIENLIAFVPKEESHSGFLSKIASLFGKESGKIENLASLAGGFKALNLEGDMVGKFIPIILSFAQSKGGDTLKNMLEKALK